MNFFLRVTSCFIFLFYSSITSLFSQQKQSFTISGYVKDGATGEFSIGTNVYVKELLKGANTNQYGFYSITVEKGTYHIVATYLGYQNFVKEVVLDKDVRLNIELKPEAITTEVIEVSSEKSDKNISSSSVGTVKMDMEEIKKIPAFMGEVDVLKTVQLLPGVKSAGEGNTGFYVRGGGPDQNLILLDEAVVYNASHLLGFFSVFNGDAVKSITLTKGGMPAQYGGRLASVLDISMKEGNNKKYHVDGGIGVISSRLTVQGPIKKDTSSFIVSARRTYIDALAKPFAKAGSTLRGSGYYFYDLNAKVNYRISDKDRIFLSGYFGRDVLSFNDKISKFNLDVAWGNSTGVMRWNHLFNHKLFMNTSAIFSDYNFSFGAGQSGFEFKLFSGIRDWNAKVDFSYFPNIRNEIKFGGNYIFHTFRPTSVSAKQGDVDFNFGQAKKDKAHEAAVYVSDDIDVTDKLKIHAGLRYSYFMQVGPFDRYIKDPINGQTTDIIHYTSNQKVKQYGGFEPRVNMRYQFNSKSSIKASYTYNLQYIHLASLSSVALPTDTWVPCSQLVQPQKGTQYSLGYFRNFKENMFETSVEIYYKEMKNQIEYKDGSLPSADINDNADNQFTFGKGWAYGAEFFIKKRMGKFNGWLGYTLSYTKRQFDAINNGNTYYAKYDRRHDISFVASYDLNKKWTFSSVFVYSSGNAITVPVSYYIVDGNFVTEYGARNAFRMPAYHRLDIAATYTPDRAKRIDRKKQKLIKQYEKAGKDTSMIKVPKRWAENYESSWSFSVFNVYNRHNPYIIYFSSAGSLATGDYKAKAKQIYLFPILPSVTWNFKF